MSFLLALVGFAAVIAVYSTIVSVLVEGIHKIFALRSAGMSEMLRAFYDQKLAALQPPDTPAELGAPTLSTSEVSSPQSREFARSISRRASSENLRPWYIRRWPLIGSIMSSRSQKLSTLQFIERLAETPEGQALAGYDRRVLRRALSAAAYEYERIGEAQSEYFRSRAKMLSVIAGICVAVFINLDAIALYRELATNATLSARLSTLAENDQFSKLQQFAQDGEVSVETPQLMISDVSNMAASFTELGIPIGRQMFPHCEGYRHEGEGDQPEGTYRDERCGYDKQRTVNKTWQETYQEYFARTHSANASFADRTWGDFLAYRWSRVAAIAYNFQTFAMWFLGILIGGGLLGLGAPFWFKLFGQAAALVAPMARATLAAPTIGRSKADTETASGQSRQESLGRPVRDCNALSPADLERAYLTVMGRGTEVALEGDEPIASYPGDLPPEGRIIGTLPEERWPDGEA